ncbi:pyridoxamine 5'-phosphate oxidase family protein [Streptomyces sp. NPDC047000]|uniref:pyridoxamine 5'-phosphate oxidase family protein n=1 Tax=Streptomyces sp. NPDC047000 TaxID=3155474 RepID=UPI0033D74033
MFPDDCFRALDREECLRLLAKVPVGRVVYTRQALPAVLPVNFCLDASEAARAPGPPHAPDTCVVLCTSPGSGLVRAIDGVVVAFEADDFDGAARSGWSVVVTGRAGVVTDPAEHERLLQDGPKTWMPLEEIRFLRIEATLVTGREIRGMPGRG